MISNQILQSTLDGLKQITHADFAVTEADGRMLVQTSSMSGISEQAAEFASSKADGLESGGSHYFKVYDEKHAHTRRIPIIAISLCFIMAFAAEKYFGIADITGAYIAGIILCNVRDAEYIDRRVSINGYMFFAPMFFVGIGLKTDFSTLNGSVILFALGFVAVALLSKIIGCGGVAKLCGFNWGECLKIGVGMMTRGEVALIITNKGLDMNIIDHSFSTAVILLIIVSSISTPMLLKYLFSKDAPLKEEKS